MATTDRCIEVQRKLAEYAYSLKVKYRRTFGIDFETFMKQYDQGEIQLSTVFENLFVTTRNRLGKPTEKSSADRYDFVRVDSLRRRTPLGDMKMTVLQKDGYSRRFVINAVANKIGNIYAVTWNWMTNKPNFFCIPPADYGEFNHPKCGYKILVHPETGERTGGFYNDECSYDTWEEMCVA